MRMTRVENIAIAEGQPVGCNGCGHWKIACEVYPGQESRQHTRILGCAARTHNKVDQVEDTFKLNPLKGSKRSMAKK